MPFKLIVVVLGTLGFVALSANDAWRLWQNSWVHPLDYINLVVGLLFLVAVASGREWLRPMGLTLAGVLLVQSVFVAFGMFSANGVKGNPDPGYVSPLNVATYAGKFVLGLLLLWCMRHRDTSAWIARRSGHDD